MDPREQLQQRLNNYRKTLLLLPNEADRTCITTRMTIAELELQGLVESPRLDPSDTRRPTGTDG